MLVNNECQVSIIAGTQKIPASKKASMAVILARTVVVTVWRRDS
jgi:hypothetical protein